MTQDWNRMLKSFRTKTYRNLQEDPAAAAAANAAAVAVSTTSTVDWIGSFTDERQREEKKLNDWEKASSSGSQLLSTTRARSASEPSFLSASRAVVFPPQTVRSTIQPSSHTPPTVREISSITGLQQQIKAAFGRWRKRGGPSTSSSPPPPHSSEGEEAVGPSTASCHQPLREDIFSHPLNVRVSAQSQTFSHPHRLTVFPPFPSPGGSSSSNGGKPTSGGGGGGSGPGSNRPFSFVRGLRKRRGTGTDNNAAAESQSISSDGRDRCRGDNSWSGCGQDPFGAYPLTAKSKSDHSLHRILKEENTWTVFATLRPPNEKGGGSLSKGSTAAWTFGLFSGDTPPTTSSLSSSTHQRSHRQTGSCTPSGKNRAASVAPSPELLHRTFTPTPTACIPQATLLPSFLVRNERRTRSLERCSHQRIQQRSSPAAPIAPFSSAYVTKPTPPPPSVVRSRSLERTYHISTTRIGGGIGVASPSSASNQQNSNPIAPTPPRRNQVPPEVLATWCTFNEAFGGNRPPPPPPPASCEPFADERDSPGSPVFEELFLPPPQRFSESSGAAGNNKRNSFTGSGSCSCSCGGHSAACSSRSSPIPPSHVVALPETVLYGTREAPVLERHCVEGGEFIIAWLSHSGSPSSSSGGGSGSSGGNVVIGTHNCNNNNKSSTPPYPRVVEMNPSGGGASNGGGGGGSNRSFINKPARGWLHSDSVIVREGITYFVRYIGCLEVNTSMKSLDFDTRSQIAKECINLVCETAGLKTVDKKRKVDRRIQRILGDAPHMDHAGSDVALTISSGCLRITTLEGSSVVACHDMPNISFASGGDPDTLDFVAYVAKDSVHGRACYVLECGGGLAQDVITTVGQAFELRFKEYLKRTPRPGAIAATAAEAVTSPTVAESVGASGHPQWTPDDPEYYNDLPGKVPPDVGNPPPVPPLPNYQAAAAAAAAAGAKKSVVRHGQAAVDLSDNLIDLNADVPVLSRTEGASGPSGATAVPPSPFSDHEYVNGIMGSSGNNTNVKNPGSKDPFDMHPFSATLPSPLLAPSGGFLSSSKGVGVVTMQRGGLKAIKPRGNSVLEAQLSQEVWFHGPISRKEAEDLLKHDGDFLVRESQGSQGQYVLTGMQSGHHKHLLLVDPEGVVRTKDRTFESVSHLINYHRNNILPIISAESVLLLKRPVPRPHHS